MSDKPKIIILDDEQAVLDSALETFPTSSGWQLEENLLNRKTGKTLLGMAISKLEINPASLLLIDWLPVKQDNQMLERLENWIAVDPRRMTQIILSSWQPPGVFKDDVDQYRFGHLRRLQKPLSWNDVLPATRGRTAFGAPNVRRKNNTVSRRRLLHVDAGRYQVHPDDMNETNFWPVPQFEAHEIERLQQGQNVVKLHRGWLPWSERNSAKDWFQLLSVARRRQDDQFDTELLWQFAIPHPDEPWQPPTPDDAVDNLFKLMAEVGFHRGRYYEIDQLPDEKKTRILQLTRANHPVFFEGRKQPAMMVLPVTRELKGELLDQANEFIEDYKRKKSEEKLDDLIYKVRQKCVEKEDGNSDQGITFWNELVGTTHLSARLDFPIYKRKKTTSRDNQSPDITWLLGWMIFDRFLDDAKGADEAVSTAQVKATAASEFEAEKSQIEERVRIVKSLVLNALDQVRTEKENRQNRHSEQQSQFRKDFRQRLGFTISRDDREKELVAFAMLVGGLAPKSKESSVIYARFDAATKSLTVTQDTTGRLLKQEFPVSSNFALARCAASKKLRVVPNWQDLHANEKLKLTDWQTLPGMSSDRADELSFWAANEILTTVALPVLSKGATLLGVLVERHKHPYHFSRQQIDNLQSLVDTALPYLELDAERATADTWDGAVMHEIRSGIQTPLQSLTVLVRDASLTQPQQQAIRGALYGIEDLRDLSNMFLENIGKNDRRTRGFHYPGNIGDHWSEQIDAYGRYRAEQWAGLKEWQAEFETTAKTALVESNKLIRVLRILIDNAFHYGRFEDDSTPSIVRLFAQQRPQDVLFKVSSRGEFSESIVQGRFRNQSDRLDLGGRSLRVHLGLSLADDLIREQGQALFLENDPNDQIAVAKFVWPLEVATTGTSEKGSQG